MSDEKEKEFCEGKITIENLTIPAAQIARYNLNQLRQSGDVDLCDLVVKARTYLSLAFDAGIKELNKESYN